jgi:hypothetical protein
MWTMAHSERSCCSSAFPGRVTVRGSSRLRGVRGSVAAGWRGDAWILQGTACLHIKEAGTWRLISSTHGPPIAYSTPDDAASHRFSKARQSRHFPLHN